MLCGRPGGQQLYTFAEATLKEDLPSWIAAHCRALEFFGGVPEVIVLDNARVGVNRVCRYEPDFNPTYQEMAAHYGTVVIPARPRKTPGQGQGRSWGAGSRALDPGGLKKPHLL